MSVGSPDPGQARIRHLPIAAAVKQRGHRKSPDLTPPCQQADNARASAPDERRKAHMRGSERSARASSPVKPIRSPWRQKPPRPQRSRPSPGFRRQARHRHPHRCDTDRACRASAVLLKGATSDTDPTLKGGLVQSRESERVRVLEADPGLFEAVPASSRDAAREGLQAERVTAASGPWSPEGLVDPSGLGILILEGLLTRDLQLAGTRSREILGAGDVLRPWDDDSALDPVPSTTSWTVLEPASVPSLTSAGSCSRAAGRASARRSCIE